MREKIVKPHGYKTPKGYVMVYADRRYKLQHVVAAERALGKELPKGAVVHHLNGNKADNRPENLVICPSELYHRLLHRRTEQLGLKF